MAESLSPKQHRQTRWLLTAILCLALAARLYWILVADPTPKLSGGDGIFYLNLGRAIAEGETFLQMVVGGLIAVGPVYPVYLAVWYGVLPDDSVVLAARVGQAVLDMVMCALVFDLGRRSFDERVGLLAALVIAVDLRFIVQSAAINTETIFIFLLVAGVWLFVIARSNPAPWRLVGANVLLILAALTRAIALPLPLIFDGLLLLPRPTMAQLRWLTSIVTLAAVGIGGWALQIYLTTGQLVVISTGFEGHFWMGSRSDGQWHGIVAFEAERKEMQARYGGRDAYVEDALRTITANPAAYVRLLFAKVVAAYLQPHGTVTFPGESLKEMAAKVLQGQLSLSELINGPAFWPKLYIYVFHFAGLIGGLIGLWLARRKGLAVLPLVIPIVYLTAVYTVLTIIPRYIFPATPFYVILAAYAMIKLLTRKDEGVKRQT